MASGRPSGSSAGKAPPPVGQRLSGATGSSRPVPVRTTAEPLDTYYESLADPYYTAPLPKARAIAHRGNRSVCRGCGGGEPDGRGGRRRIAVSCAENGRRAESVRLFQRQVGPGVLLATGTPRHPASVAESVSMLTRLCS
jgi:hypothetical protein